MSTENLDLKILANVLAVTIFRNGEIEEIHCGKVPHSKTGDFSDVYVLDADGRKIPWSYVSRITQDEMKILNKGVASRIYEYLLKKNTSEYGDKITCNLKYVKDWDLPELQAKFIPDNKD